MMDLQLNPHLDVDRLLTDFRRDGFVQVPDLLAEDQAAALARCLTSRVPWGLAYFDGGAQFLRRHEIDALTPERRQALERQIYQRARSDYQYAYSAYPVLDAYLQGWNEVPLLNEFLEGLNGPAMIDLVRSVTGMGDIIKADAQATRYGPGQFLRRHTDQSPANEVWRVAYVYNLTPEWQPDWGGYLLLLDGHGDVRRGFRPRYNVLNLLAVPQPHLVSLVSPFAGAARYAITGWFRSR
jgi:Rps23 Pro-64 3,4-dihydroxylase Tpa1-like proline 4-hydroxylase